MNVLPDLPDNPSQRSALSSLSNQEWYSCPTRVLNILPKAASTGCHIRATRWPISENTAHSWNCLLKAIFRLPTYRQKERILGEISKLSAMCSSPCHAHVVVPAHAHSCQYTWTVGWYERFSISVTRPLKRMMLPGCTIDLSPGEKLNWSVHCLFSRPGPGGAIHTFWIFSYPLVKGTS